MLATDLLALAEAVTSLPHARTLGADNTASRPIPVDEAVRSGLAYLVTPRPGLLVVDLDLPKDPTRTADVLAAFDELITTARHTGVPTLVVPSGSPGHTHAYLVTGTGPHRARVATWARRHGLDVRDRGVRPPGAPHRALPGRAWDPDLNVAEVLAVLTAPADGDATAALARRLGTIDLPGRVMVAIRAGHARAGYPTPSHARMGLAVAIRARGGTRGLLATILGDRSSPLGATYRARPATWQRAEVERLWDKAGAWLATRNPDDPRQRLDLLAGAAHSWRWRGVAGGSDLAVLEELLRRARRVPTLTVGVSLSDVAVGAGVSRDTARAALGRLQAAGWVSVVCQETPRTTRTYALLLPPGADPTPGVVPDAGSVGDLGADWARARGLGKVTTRVLRTLVGKPMSTGELGRVLSMRSATVRYHLRKLLGAGLVTGTGARWLPVGDVTGVLEQVAVSLGVAGSRVRQQAQVLAERAARAAARATGAKLRRRSVPPPLRT